MDQTLDTVTVTPETTQFVADSRPADFDETDPTDWFHRGLHAVESPAHEQRAFVADCLTVHVRELVDTDHYTYDHQTGLTALPPAESLLHSFVVGIDDWALRTRSPSMCPTVIVECVASTIETAMVSQPDTESAPQQEPDQAHTTFVDATLQTQLKLTQYGFEGSASIDVEQHQPQSQPDTP